jgi:hypothetical protein
MATVEFDKLAAEFHDSDDISSAFIEDLECLARHYIAVFFQDKVGKDGKPVSPRLLYKTEYVSNVMNLETCQGIDCLYSAIGEDYSDQEIREFERNGQVERDIRRVVKLIGECAKKGVPQCFAPGILCIWAEVCEGKKVQWPETYVPDPVSWGFDD